MSDDILDRIDKVMAANARRFDPLGPTWDGPPPSGVDSDTPTWVPFADVAAGPSADADGAVDVRRRVQDGGAPDRVGDILRAEVLRQGLAECQIDGVLWEYRDGAWQQVEALRPAPPPVVVWDRRRSLECVEAGLEHGGCRGDAADLLSACLCDCHLPKSPWWKRWLP